MKKISLPLLMTASAGVMAHPGHDHSIWTSNVIHVLTVLAIAGVFGTAVYAWKHQKNAIKQEVRQSKKDELPK